VTDAVRSPSFRATTAANRSDIMWAVRSLGSQQQITMVTDTVDSPSTRATTAKVADTVNSPSSLPQRQLTVMTDIVVSPSSRATTVANSND